RLLDDHARPGDRVLLANGAPREARGADVAQERVVRRGRRREIEDPVPREAALLLDLAEEPAEGPERGVILERPGHVVERLREARPLRRGGARILHRVPHLVTERLGRELPPGEAHDRGPWVEELLLREMEERGDEL